MPASAAFILPDLAEFATRRIAALHAEGIDATGAAAFALPAAVESKRPTEARICADDDTHCCH